MWGIPKETIKKTILPLGNLTKQQVRKIALDSDLETANEPESMEICFIADNNYKISYDLFGDLYFNIFSLFYFTSI